MSGFEFDARLGLRIEQGLEVQFRCRQMVETGLSCFGSERTASGRSHRAGVIYLHQPD